VVVTANGGGERHRSDSILAAVPRRLALLLVLALAGCGGSSKPASTPQPTAKGTATSAAPAGCQKVPHPPAQDESLPKPHTRLDPRKTYVATVRTSCGSFRITLDAKRAPLTGGSFLYLVRHRFYDGLTFHRVAKGFVIQGGDPKGDGSGGPGYTVVEPPPKTLRYTRGVVAMAKTATDPSGASGSQFFVVTGPDAGLGPQYALLGRVTAGEGTVSRIDALGNAQEQPTQVVLIRSIRIRVS
jgi:peptidyl-prolyl cis-trans isomerase B (cyclophilin B)